MSHTSAHTLLMVSSSLYVSHMFVARVHTHARTHTHSLVNIVEYMTITITFAELPKINRLVHVATINLSLPVLHKVMW